MNLCEKCYKEVYQNAPASFAENSSDNKSIGGLEKASNQEKNTPEDPLTRRISFLINEREQKNAELEQIAKRKKSTGQSGLLHAVLGDGIETHMLEMQQMDSRTQDIQSEIRKIDFEIEQLQSEETNNVTQNTQTDAEEKIFCRYCGVQNETDAVFCKKCGKKIA